MPVCPAEVKDTEKRQRGDLMLTAPWVDSPSCAALSTSLILLHEAEVTESELILTLYT